MLVKCPLDFVGDFGIFFERFVEPNLPPVERVRLFDRLISEYIKSADPAYIVRRVRGIDRNNVFSNAHHNRILGSDNSPGIWVHATLMGTAPISGIADDLFKNVPRHIFRIPKIETLRSAGYHLAHIVSAKNGDTKWQDWSKSELERRFLLNVHPCNWFLAAKSGWRLHGGRADIIDWVKSAYRQRYGDMYESFLERTGNVLVMPSEQVCSPPYSFSDAAVGKIVKTKKPELVSAGHGNSITGIFPKLVATRRPHVQKRLLGHDVTLHITTVGMQFLVPHDALWQWVESETNVSNTKSWRDLGHYHWPTPSVQMLSFLDDFKK